MNPLSLFQRANKRLPLTPEERAILKFVYLAFQTAAVTGLTAVAQYVGTSGKSINWQVVAFVFLGAASVSFGETGRKWVTAHGDGPWGMALQLVTAAAQRTGIAKQTEQLFQATQATPSTSEKDPVNGAGVPVAGH